MRYRLVEAEKAEHAISRLCTVLGMTRQGFYAWRRRGPSLRRLGDEQLKRLTVTIYDGSLQTYGAPRVQLDLRDDHDVHVGRKRVARLMRELELQGVSRRGKKPRTTVADEKAPPAPDLVERRFVADRPTALWLADITYVPTLEGYLFLGVVMDMFSRKIVGWSMRDDLRADLVVDAQPSLTTAARTAGRGTTIRPVNQQRCDGPLNPGGHLARLRHDAARIGRGGLDGISRRRLRQRRLRIRDLDAEGRVDQAAPLREPRPGAALDLPLHRDVLQPAPPPLLARRDQPRRVRTAFSDQTTRKRS